MLRPYIHAAAGLAVALAGVTCGSPLRGEVFVLRSGGRVEGEHLNPQRAAGQPFRLRTEDGLVLELAESAVARVVIKSDVQREYDAKLPGVPNSVDGHWEMAQWCLEVGLTDERRRHLVSIIALDPNHAEARRVLGYSLYGSKWMTQDEYLQSRGYVRSKGVWRLQQEIELEVLKRERDKAEKELRQDIRTWFEQIAAGNRYAANADRKLNELRDPAAAPALADILSDGKSARGVRLRCLEILSRLPPGLATLALVRTAMNDNDDAVRDRCLDELIRAGSANSAPAFVAELSSKKNYKIEFNWRVNRAAYCLERLGYKDATVQLIDALVTEHQELVQPPSAPPGGLPLNFSSGGPNGGMGGMSMGGRPKVQKKKLENSGVRDALTRLYPGVNFQYDIDAWKSWYVQKFTTINVDLRRDE